MSEAEPELGPGQGAPVEPGVAAAGANAAESGRPVAAEVCTLRV